MKTVRLAGRLLIAAGGLAAWAAWAGALVPALDTAASFLPLFGMLVLLGALLGARRLPWMAIALVALVPVVAAMGPELLREIPRARPGTPRLRVVTHNVWVGNETPEATARRILEAQPDVVLLQEVDREFRPMLAQMRGELPYATDCPADCSLAILSRWPIAERDYFFKDTRGRPFGPPLLWAQLAVPGMPPVTVATTHYPHPGPAQARRRAEMAQTLARIDRGSLIVAGDMNLTPWSAAMRAQDASFAPLVRFTRALASWRRPVPILPIDHLYAGPDWGVVQAKRLPATGSDHYPVLVTLGRR